MGLRVKNPTSKLVTDFHEPPSARQVIFTDKSEGILGMNPIKSLPSSLPFVLDQVASPPESPGW